VPWLDSASMTAIISTTYIQAMAITYIGLQPGSRVGGQGRHGDVSRERYNVMQ
jgi:hypothetical protein